MCFENTAVYGTKLLSYLNFIYWYTCHIASTCSCYRPWLLF